MSIALRSFDLLELGSESARSLGPRSESLESGWESVSTFGVKMGECLNFEVETMQSQNNRNHKANVFLTVILYVQVHVCIALCVFSVHDVIYYMI